VNAERVPAPGSWEELEELDKLRHEYGDDLSITALRKILSRRRRLARERERALRKREQARLVLPGRAPGTHPSRPWWRWDGRRWLRTDGQNWPGRSPGVLEAELERFDRDFALRPGAPREWPGGTPIPRSRIRRVDWKAATLPLRLVRDVFSFERRVVGFRRIGHEAAATFYGRQAETRRRQVAELRVRVPWAGRLLGQGAAP
jgi:hypothetical protein